MDTPLVSCLMVTRNRLQLARRSLACLQAQTWPRLELVVVDNGEETCRDLLEPLRTRMEVRYLHVPPVPGRWIGNLRNIALDHANGEYCATWDDDDWFHPTRIEAQMSYLQSHSLMVVTLEQVLMHIGTGRFASHPFVSIHPDGAPHTMLHVRTSQRYQNLPRSSDVRFHDELRSQLPAGYLGREGSHLYVRCYHGDNIWDRAHFERRLRRTWRYKLEYAWARWIRGDVLYHPAFRLDAREQATAEAFFTQSRAMGLVDEM